MKKIAIALTLLVTYLVYGLYLSQYPLLIIPSELSSDHPEGFHDYRGAINVHTELSTGSGSLSDVIKAAQNSDLDFLFVTDLNDFDPPKHLEGYHDNLLVFVDGEYSYLNTRLLNLDFSSRRDGSMAGQSNLFFADMLSQTQRPREQGILVLAHPLKSRANWEGELPPGIDGIEIVNLKSIWQDAWKHDKISFIWSLLVYPFNDRLSLIRLFRDPTDEVQLWHELNQKRKTLAFAGSDAEARIRLGDSTLLRYPSYETLFSLVSNHVLMRSELTGNATSDREKLTAALRQGQFYLSLDILANPKGFNAVILSNNTIHPIGSTLPWHNGMEMLVRLPHKPDVPFDIEIYRDNEKIVTSNAQTTQFTLPGPGQYRVKVRVIPTFPLPDGKKWVPWIYTNAFYISSSGTPTNKPSKTGN